MLRLYFKEEQTEMIGDSNFTRYIFSDDPVLISFPEYDVKYGIRVSIVS